MAVFEYAQSDTSTAFDVGCSGQTGGATTFARSMVHDGVTGTTATTGDPGNNVTRACVSFVGSTSPGVATWAAGDYVVPVNHTSMDAGTRLSRVDICDSEYETFFTSVASTTTTGHTIGATGVVTVTVNRGTDYTPQSQADSRVYVVLTYVNTDAHGGSNFQITPNQIITTPILQPTNRRVMIIS